MRKNPKEGGYFLEEKIKKINRTDNKVVNLTKKVLRDIAIPVLYTIIKEIFLKKFL